MSVISLTTENETITIVELTPGVLGGSGVDGKGWTGGSYASGTGIVTFTSDDGLGFVTDDLRGTNGTDGDDGADGSDGADGVTPTLREAVAISDNDTALTTGIKFTWYSPPYAITITDIELSVLTAPTDASLIVDLHDDGTTIMATDKLDIDTGEFHTKDATTQPAITDGSIAASSKMEAEIDQIGSTVAGAGAVLYIYYTVDA